MKKKKTRYSLVGIAMSVLLSSCAGTKEESITATNEVIEEIADLTQVENEATIEADSIQEQEEEGIKTFDWFGEKITGQNWHVNQYRTVIEGSNQKDSIAIGDAIKKLSSSKEKYELWISAAALETVDFSKMHTEIFTGLHILAPEDRTTSIELSSLVLPHLPNVNEIRIDAETLKYLDPISLNTLMKNLANNRTSFSDKGNVDIYAYGENAYTEEGIKNLRIALSNLDDKSINKVSFRVEGESKELLNALQDVEAESITFDTCKDGYCFNEKIRLNDKTKNLYLIGYGGLADNLTIIGEQSLNVQVNVANGLAPENTIYSIPNGGTIEIYTHDSIPSQASINSLKKYNGVYNGVAASELISRENIMKKINSASEYISVSREKEHVTVTINMKDEGFSFDQTINDILQFAKKYDINKKPDILLNVYYDKGLAEIIDLKDEIYFNRLGKVIINLYTKSSDILTLLDNYAVIDNLTINCHDEVDFDYEYLNYILSTKINNGGLVNLNGIKEPEEIICTFENPLVWNTEDPKYSLTINGNQIFVTKEKGQNLSRVIEADK